MKVAIIGAGLMGHGFALVFAAAGHDVCITDADAKALGSVRQRIADSLRAIGKPQSVLQRIRVVPTLPEAVQGAGFVLEAVLEKLPLKQAIFREIEAAAPPDAILASNTSVIPITKVMARVKNKKRALGTHWFNPPFLVPLVEVIQTRHTSPAVVDRTMQLMAELGKVPVHVKKDLPGFVGNRLQHAMWREAISLVDKGVCDAETVDKVVTNSFGRRLGVIGPMAGADLVGTDLALDIQNQVLPALEDSHKPTRLLKRLVKAGRLGFKTNQGFFTWTEESKAALRKKLVDHLKSFG
jgi:3-hydroxybutyryl-CoA dehydrogenase